MNRRDFFKTLAVATFATEFGRITPIFSGEDVPHDPNLIAIFSDTHLHGPETTQHVVRFKKCVNKILAMNPLPANLLIYGDVAYLQGKIEEYQLFRELIKPIEAAGIKWEIAMGNHDRIANYREIFPERFTNQPIEDRYVNIVATPHADFILLDSYLEGQVKGWISPEQRTWLEGVVKTYDKKPFFVGCHHPLKETELAELLKSCPKCVAYLHGHHHYYRTPIDRDMRTICFPSVGHWGDMGFVMANLTETEATFTPDIDEYQWSKYGYVKEPEKNVEEYMAQLNANSPVFTLP
ncbi:MAG: metallophosphoesterase [Planctomycetia bacterium]|nr:metallophosphoesterase [Planctomycetia bacterium]